MSTTNKNPQSNQNPNRQSVDPTGKTQLVQQGKPKQPQDAQSKQPTNKNAAQQVANQPNKIQTPQQTKQKQVQNNVKQNPPQQEEKKVNLKSKQDEYFENLKKQIDGEKLRQVAEMKVDRRTNRIQNMLSNGRMNIIGQSYRKGDIIEDDIIEKKIMDAQKLKEQLKAQLNHLEYRLDNLSSQRIDNPKSLYSHPVLKQYLETDQDRKKQQATRFIKKLQKKQDEFSEKIKQKLDEIEYKKKLEESKAQRIIMQQKQNKEKEREDRAKQQLQKIKQRHDQRIKDLNEFEDIYNKKIKKDPSKKPLYLRFTKKYNNQEKVFREKKLKEMKEKRKSLIYVAKIDFKKHEQNYFENLKRLEEQKKQNREKMILNLQNKQPTPNLVYDSAKLLKNEITSNQFPNKIESQNFARENAQKIVDARNKFSNALKQHQELSPDKTKQLEMEILIDKQINPTKYLPQVKKRTESERYSEYQEKGKLVRKRSADFSIRKSASSMSLFNAKSFQTPKIRSKQNLITQEDEMIFKEKVKLGFTKQEPGKEREIGKLYLKSIRESNKQYMDYLKHRQIQTEASHDGKLNQDLMGITDQNEIREAMTTASAQKSTKTSDNIKLPPLINNQKKLQKDFSNSFSNNNSRFSYQVEVGKRNSVDKYFSQNQEAKSPSDNIERMKPQKQNYMIEMRQKYHLDGRKEKWEKINDQNVSLPILAKKQLLEEAYYKYDQEISRKEQILRSHRPQELSLKEVEDRQSLDDAYLKSIKAKLEMMKLTIDNDEFVKKKVPKQRYQLQQQQEEYNNNYNS